VKRVTFWDSVMVTIPIYFFLIIKFNHFAESKDIKSVQNLTTIHTVEEIMYFLASK
jgi:hypothetical protein